MGKLWLNNWVVILLLSVVIICFQLLIAAPWWIFVVPVFVAGYLAALSGWKVNFLFAGFAAGFASWFGASLFFDFSYHGLLLAKIGLLFSLPKIAVMAGAGIIGGLLAGLSFFSGVSLRKATSGLSSDL